MDFFDMVPDNFFSLLASKNKRIYLASILEVFKVYETGTILGIDKKVVVDDLVYFLDTHKNYFYDVEDEEDEESNPSNKRELANYILRRMEETGWIYVDVTNDYMEVLNFSDDAIILCEAILNAYPEFEYTDDSEIPADFINVNEYKGYIYNIYSLLNQTDNVDYATTFSLVYSDTRKLIRALRKLDARMKDYITSVVDNTEIKDLMEKLITYKNEIYDKSYSKLKIQDNIDRYRLSIITKLEDMQTSEVVVKSISYNYLEYSKSPEEAIDKAIKQIDEVIDAFNAIEDFVLEIDKKNRDYINSTIGKIKFLLSEEDNIIGKLNSILKFVHDSNKKNKIDRSLRLVNELYELPELKILENEKSLYTPRGNYTRNYNQYLDDLGFDGFEMDEEFMKQFKNSYNEDEIKKFLEYHMMDDLFKASFVLKYDSDRDFFLMCIYSLIYAAEHNYLVKILDSFVDLKDYKIKDFEIRRK
ncbi:MAG: hypothetical protein J5936_03250 [Acholeplasmatales bacterium]|nr:hypothetical protein [Acholeplasmatales bacterium]